MVVMANSAMVGGGCVVGGFHFFWNVRWVIGGGYVGCAVDRWL